MSLRISREHFIAFVIILGSVFLSAFFVTSATSKDDIVFPVPELGGCMSELTCKLYCADSTHINECLDFAEQHNLMSSEELRHARRFADIGAVGPGGCSSRDECDAYCDDISNIDECLSFAEANGIIPPEELAEGRKVQAALRSGAALPGGCRNKNECEAYCDDPAHPERIEECISFAEAAGFIPPEELAEARKVLKAIRAGHTPPPCRGDRECDRYCSLPGNMESCMEFAIAAEMVPPRERAEMQKMLGLIRQGINPPNCRGDRECDIYCSEPENVDECMTFAVAAGFVSEEDAEMMRRTGGRGPGGCKGRECETFCDNPANNEVCFEFAMEHGLIPEEDLKRIEEGRTQMLEAVESAPPVIVECFKSRLGQNIIEELRSGARMPSEEMGDHVRMCFEENMSEMMGPRGAGGEGFGPGEPSGPTPEQILQAVPPEMRGCVSEMIGPELLALGPDGIREAVGKCVNQGGAGFGPVRVPLPENSPDLDAFRQEDGLSPFIREKREVEAEFEDGGFEINIQEEIRRRTEEETQRRIQEEIQRRTEEETQRRIEEEIRQRTEDGGGASLLTIIKRILFVKAK